MKNLIYITLVFFLIAGCKPGVPNELIQPDEMAKVLHDIHIADAMLNEVPNPDSAKAKAAAYYKGIYKKYDIDSALFTQSMDYYNKNPIALNEIYVKVTADLTSEKNTIVKADSLATDKQMKLHRLKITRDSIRTTDSIFWRGILLRDTVKLKDTLKKKIEVIQPRFIYKK